MTVAFKLKSSPKEADIQSSIEDALNHLISLHKVAWACRINGGGSMVTGKGGRMRFMAFYRLYGFGKPAHKGVADIIGQTTGGVFFAIEVKRPGEKATTEQRAFLDRVNAHGGIGILAFSVDDVFGAIK